MLLLLLGCPGPVDDTGAAVPPLLVRSAMNPFPTADLVVDGALTLDPAAVPAVEGGGEWDFGRLAVREGFSPVQTSVAMFEVAIDPTSLPGETEVGVGGSVRMFDRDTGEELPLFAELDAHPDAIASGRRALLVRPMHTLTPGHRVVVAVTAAVRTTDGAPLSTADWDAQVAAGGAAAELDEALAGLGVDDVAYAWEFPVGDGTRATRAIAASVTTPTAWTFERVRDADEDALPAGVWRQAEGTLSVDSWLVDDTHFALDPEGVPQRQGQAEAHLFVHLPTSVRDAAPGTVPVLIFGHGILSDPGNYLGEADDPSNVVRLAEELGVIVVATTWRGLTTDDLLHAVEVANDFTRFPELTDMLAQGVANNLSLLRAVRGGLLDDPLFEGLGDPDRVWWYGISLGSIEGSVTLANQDVIERAALHVGGSAWSTMLERSSNWPAFEQGVTRTIPDPWDRQQVIAISQLWWDQVDPASYVGDLAGRGYLWQEAIGDDQVPNLTTELWMRSLGVPLGTPGVTAPFGVASVALPTTGPVFTQFDPMLPWPPEGNRPAPTTGAHGAPRLWEGCLDQTVHYLQTGEVAHFCGDGPCTAENPGE